MKLRTLKDILEEPVEASRDDWKLGGNYALGNMKQLGEEWYKLMKREPELYKQYLEKGGVYKFIQDFFGIE